MLVSSHKMVPVSCLRPCVQNTLRACAFGGQRYIYIVHRCSDTFESLQSACFSQPSDNPNIRQCAPEGSPCTFGLRLILPSYHWEHVSQVLSPTLCRNPSCTFANGSHNGTALGMVALEQYNYIFAVTTLFAGLDAWNIGMVILSLRHYVEKSRFPYLRALGSFDD